MTIVRFFASLVNPELLAARLGRWSPLPLRLLVGYGFMAHGYAKIFKHPENFAAILHALSVPVPHFLAWTTIAIELLGGFAILIGAFVPLVTIPMIAVLLVATLTVHLQFGFTSIKLMAVTSAGPRFGPPGYETDLLYIASLVSLVFSGAGPLAIEVCCPGVKQTGQCRPSADQRAGDCNKAEETR
jgi:putative oxidoreductase